MSQFSTMTTRERKMQAAAICREVQGQEDAQMEFGKKMSVPKDIMLEELSLTSNRGSRLFKMRQRRSEKFTFESIQNENNIRLNNSVAPQAENEDAAVGNSSEGNMSKVTFDTPETKVVPDPSSIAPGYGGPLKDIPPEKFNSTAVPKLYQSPWEQAINKDPSLAATLIAQLPEMDSPADLPGYKSFNRTATPFGGFSRAPTSAPIMAFHEENLPELPAPQGESAVHRPSFNRSALGWVSSGGLAAFPTVPLEPLLIPESDDL
ncbi:myozenin-2-like [Cololabis saira]|uniref:myozenin-2-like n=1 Tax=Cololabis saira TaxID=129043 RepID=UPI002AD46C67|nr:myozenin-2-like [Cololabis saira]